MHVLSLVSSGHDIDDDRLEADGSRHYAQPNNRGLEPMEAPPPSSPRIGTMYACMCVCTCAVVPPHLRAGSSVPAASYLSSQMPVSPATSVRRWDEQQQQQQQGHECTPVACGRKAGYTIARPLRGKREIWEAPPLSFFSFSLAWKLRHL